MKRAEIFQKLSIQNLVLSSSQEQEEVDSTTKFQNTTETKMFIIKPVASSRGRGIEVVSSARELELFLSQARCKTDGGAKVHIESLLLRSTNLIYACGP